MKKKFLTGILAGLMAFGSFGSFEVQAATRDEIAAIQVQTAADFKYWNDDSPTKQKIIEFVEAAIDPNSPNFIPVENRIATFDLDGTIYCETAPLYFQEMMLLYRVLEDDSYTPTKAELSLAKKVKPLVMEKKPIPAKLNEKYVAALHGSYAGMTPEEYRAYVKNFMNHNVVGLTNLKRGEAFYLPMVEIISYLHNNGFTVYMDSACERETLRCLVEDILPIQRDNILATDIVYVSTKQGKSAGDQHTYDRYTEKVVRSAKTSGENGKNNKIFSILNEIGRKPVLAFGNSGGDASMLEYVLQDNPYNSAAFFVICDDTTRELGNPTRAEKDRATAIKRGWNPISMRDEFKTIYGDNVRKG